MSRYFCFDSLNTFIGLNLEGTFHIGGFPMLYFLSNFSRDAKDGWCGGALVHRPRFRINTEVRKWYYLLEQMVTVLIRPQSEHVKISK